MKDPRDPVWDEYHRMCQLHKQMLIIEERTGKPHPDAYDTALECYNLMKKCLSPDDDSERLDPAHAAILEYVTENPYVSQRELHEQGGFRSDQIKQAVEKLDGKIGMDMIAGTVRYWHDVDRRDWKTVDIADLMEIYVNKCYPVKVIHASRHVNVPEYRVRKILNDGKFPKGQLINEAGQAITGYYPHGHETKQSVSRGRINNNAFADSKRRRKSDDF